MIKNKRREVEEREREREEGRERAGESEDSGDPSLMKARYFIRARKTNMYFE